MASCLIFDEHGGITDGRDAPPAHDVDAESRVHLHKRSHYVELRFRHEAVSPVALTAVFVWLHQNFDRPLAFRPSADGPIEIVRERRRALRLLSDMVARRNSDPPFKMRRLVLARSRFKHLHRIAAEVLRAGMVTSTRDQILDDLFEGRFTLNAYDPERETCHAYMIGSKTFEIDAAFSAKGRERTYRDLSDKAFGAWMASTFADYRKAQQPFAVSVHAAVTLPRMAGLSWYDRLIVPFEVEGRRHVLSATAVDYSPFDITPAPSARQR